MTTIQRKKIEKIKNYIISSYIGDARKEYYEFKNFEVKEYEIGGKDTLVFVWVEFGRKGDEGTLAEVLCRSKAYFKIGPRGGLQHISNKTKKHAWKTTKFLSQAIFDYGR